MTKHPEGRLRDEILRRLERVEGGAWANRLPANATFSSDDRRRITEYVGGITRQKRWLDFVVDSFSSRGESMHPLIRHILRIGTYELIILKRAPHAAVFASVEQTKRLGRRGADKFVNGVLRALGRSLDHLPIPDARDETTALGIIHSHPDWIVRRWVGRYGAKGAAELMTHNNRRPVHSLRVNTLRSSVDETRELLAELGVAVEVSPYVPGFLRVEKLQPVIAAGLLAGGLLAVQDESAGLVGKVLDPKPGEYVIDACAAPGGKMIHAGIVMKNRGRLVGIDTNRKRLQAGLEMAKKHGVTIVEAVDGDFCTMRPSGNVPVADAVLLDAPCSGLGVLARRPDLRWRRDEESITELTSLQDQLLAAAATFVKPGGRLVYATCTIEPEENDGRVEAFLSSHPEFRLESVASYLPTSIVVDGCLTTLPHVHQMDGAFAARLVRE